MKFLISEKNLDALTDHSKKMYANLDVNISLSKDVCKL